MADRGRVAVVGSANVDLLLRLDRAPGPGETVRADGLDVQLGGKGLNQAVAAARAGAATRFVAAVGDDAHGERVTALARDEGMQVADLAVVPDTPTGTAYILIEPDGENRIVILPGANAALTTAWVRSRLAFQPGDVLMLQLESPLDVVTACAADAQAAGATVLLTPAPAPSAPLPADLLAAVDLLVANEQEAATVGGGELLDVVPAAVVTLGARGARYRDRAGRHHDVPGLTVPVVDTTGAGDTFAGYLAASLARGLPIDRCLNAANRAAATAVGRAGAVPSIPRAT